MSEQSRLGETWLLQALDRLEVVPKLTPDATAAG